MKDPIEELYREELMEHYNNPRNFGEMARPDVSFRDSNPVCGDEVTMHLRVQAGKAAKAMFTGKGCAISLAAASMLTEEVNGKTLKEITGMGQGDVLKMLRITPGPVRIKCAMLALRTLQKGAVLYEATAR